MPEKTILSLSSPMEDEEMDNSASEKKITNLTKVRKALNYHKSISKFVGILSIAEFKKLIYPEIDILIIELCYYHLSQNYSIPFKYKSFKIIFMTL